MVSKGTEKGSPLMSGIITLEQQKSKDASSSAYNTICPKCHATMPTRYYGEPKMMLCPSCTGKTMAHEAVKKVFKGVKSQ